MSRGYDAFATPDTRPHWRSRAVAWSLLAHVALTALVVVGARLLGPDPAPPQSAWLGVAPLLAPLAAVAVVSARRGGGAGVVALRAGYHVAVVPAVLLVEAPVALLAGALGAFDAAGSDYVVAGVLGAAFVVPLLLMLVLMPVGGSLTFAATTAGREPWPLRYSLALTMASILPLATGMTFGVDLAGRPNPGRLVVGLLGGLPVTSPGWLLVARLSALAFAIGLAGTVVVLLRARGAAATR